MTRAITYSALINECEKGRHAAFAKKAKLLREFCSRGPEGGGSALREYTANAPSMLTELGYAPRCVHIFAHASECDMRLFSSLQRVKYHRPLRASASLPYFPPFHHGDRTLPGPWARRADPSQTHCLIAACAQSYPAIPGHILSHFLARRRS